MERVNACAFLEDIEAQLNGWLFGRPTLADYAILPFVRQFAFIDKVWFAARDWPKLKTWLDQFLQGDEFTAIMHKYPQWKPGEEGVPFPAGDDLTQPFAR